LVTRREFLKGASVVVLGSIVGNAVGEVVPVLAEEKKEVPHLPWPYEELDPEYVRKLGHLGYYAFECAGGSYWAIMEALREKIGFPYTLLPIPTKEEVEAAVEKHEELHQIPMQYGAGGVAGWASLCGGLNGSISAITMASKNYKTIAKMLLRWYEITPFPSDKSNEYASKHEFFVKKYKSDKVLPQSVSHSVLCHVSVGKWCEVSGYASGSPERSERCARLTGDSAARAVELLNADLRGELKSVGTIPLSQFTADCRTCHYKGKNYEGGQFTRGLMQCESCHQDMRPHASTVLRLSPQGLSTDPEDKGRLDTLLGGAGLAAAAGVVGGIWSYSKSKSEKD